MGNEGILIQSGKNKLNDNKIKGNNEGLKIANGGSSPSDNVIENNDISDNVSTNVITTSVNVFRNNKGYKTENQGIASGIISGGVIPHGLVNDPSISPYGSVFIQAKGNALGGPADIRVSTDSSNITVYFSGGGTFDFYWKATVGNSF